MIPDDRKDDGIILLAEAYPHGEERIALELQYAESAEEALNQAQEELTSTITLK